MSAPNPTSKPHKLRIAIVGAGAIGGWIGMRLAERGHTVSLLARGAHLEAIRANGLRLESAASPGQSLTRRFEASDRPADLGEQDYVLITLKNTAMAAVAPTLAPLFGADTALLSLMNGLPWWFFNGFGGAIDSLGSLSSLRDRRIHSVDPEGIIAAAIEPQRIIGGVAMCSCSLPSPGLIHHASGNGIAIGEPDGSISERVTRLGAAFSDAGFNIEVSSRIRHAVWLKLLGNMSFNTVSVLTGATTDRMIDSPEIHPLFVNMMQEALALASTLGIALDIKPEERIAGSRYLGRIKSSMLQDVEAGKPIELDAIIGAVVELGDWTAQAMPHIRSVHALLKLRAQVLGLLPSGA